MALNYCLKLKSNPANPAYSCIFRPKYKEEFATRTNLVAPLGIRMENHLQSVQIDTLQVSLLDPAKFALWACKPLSIILDLAEYPKATTTPAVYKSRYLEFKATYSDFETIYTDGSKLEEKASAAAYTSEETYRCRLPDGSTVFSAELKALLLAFEHVSCSVNEKFLIFSDSLSSLQALQGSGVDNPLLMHIHNEYQILTEDQHKTVVLCWIPSHIGIPGNETADRAAKAALDLPITPIPVYYADYKMEVNSYIDQLWQERWDHQVHNKLRHVKPVIKVPNSVRYMS